MCVCVELKSVGNRSGVRAGTGGRLAASKQADGSRRAGGRAGGQAGGRADGLTGGRVDARTVLDE